MSIIYGDGDGDGDEDADGDGDKGSRHGFTDTDIDTRFIVSNIFSPFGFGGRPSLFIFKFHCE